MQLKINNNNNNIYCINSQQKVLRKNSFILPLLNKKNSNCTINNNEVNCFRRQHRKSVDQRKTNISISQINSNMNMNININNNNKENIISEKKEINNDESNENNENSEEKETKSIYKSKVQSCKQVRTKKFY